MVKQSILPILVLVLVATATLFGIFGQDGSAKVESISIRGQKVTYLTSGIYMYNPANFVREGIVWDVINLFLAVPLMVVATVLSARSRLSGKLLVAGLTAYFFYVYLGCVMMYAFNSLFLVYVAIIALSLIALFLNLMELDVRQLPTYLGPRFPRRLFIAFSFILARPWLFYGVHE